MTADPRVTRSAARTPLRRHAWIACGGSSELTPCVIWDFSDNGARIAAAHLSLLPEYFALVLSRDRNEYRACRVVWRHGRFAGLSFVSQDEHRRSPQALRRRRQRPVLF
jgi:hypothetical protein